MLPIFTSILAVDIAIIVILSILLIISFVGMLEDIKKRKVEYWMMFCLLLLCVIPAVVLRVGYMMPNPFITCASMFLPIIPIIVSIYYQFKAVWIKRAYLIDATSPFGFGDGVFLCAALMCIPMVYPVEMTIFSVLLCALVFCVLVWLYQSIVKHKIKKNMKGANQFDVKNAIKKATMAGIIPIFTAEVISILIGVLITIFA